MYFYKEQLGKKQTQLADLRVLIYSLNDYIKLAELGILGCEKITSMCSFFFYFSLLATYFVVLFTYKYINSFG